MLAARPRAVLLALLVCLTLGLALPAFASAITYTVNSIGDQVDESVGADGCKTSVGNCTLRAAIEESNASTSVDDLIIFSPLFNGSTSSTIALDAGLPAITESVKIEGKTCTTEAGGALGPCVGVSIAGNAFMMTVEAPDVTIEGLSITPQTPALSIGLRLRPGSPRFQAIGDWFGKPLNGATKYLGTGVEVDSAGIVSASDRARFTNVEVVGAYYGIYLGGPGAVIEQSSILGGAVGVHALGPNESIGTRIEDSSIGGNTADGVIFNNSGNTILGSEVSSQLGTGILVEGAVSGNLIGGDLPSEENVISEAGLDAIKIRTNEASQNQIGANRGSVGGSFLKLELIGDGTIGPNGGIQPPSIGAAFESSARGNDAVPGAKVRVYSKATDSPGEIASFLGVATADSSGVWRAVFSGKVPAGTIIAATQTNPLGGTSELWLSMTAEVDPACPSPDAVGCTSPPPICPEPGATGCTPPPVYCPMVGATGCEGPPHTDTKPKVTIKQAPKAQSKSTTAKFKFVANEANSKFKCKLDKKAFANCKSPKTYRNLKPGKHVFKVKATDPAGNVSAVVTRKFTVLE